MRFIFGVVLGIMISTVGFSGIAGFFDGAVHKLQSITRDVAANR